ncbi:ATPase [Salipiger sp. 1_MG-2023]|uniref:BadF/BadG/BcrA/BcrD ATPase family protein n=1 Tax=Salipiger sp. 1_MG-2023 TaxID=3062665 RepID=UPI0026E233E1|nr:BadF/BadG/BcrA/BcrD ATPase family protein [Salipiger sp. 1_MG-2023]MDO6585891.1 ATPase [Salipiger sp. 1_MG-2023]
MILGVDAGGSTCRLALASGAQRFDVTLGPCNVTSDFDGAIAVLLTGLEQLAARAGVTLSALAPCPAWLALAGVTGPAMAERVRTALPLTRAIIDEDRRAALVGALDARDGCLVGIGTGSYLARQHNGGFATLGGHGLVLGDEASGAWLGRELLVYALRAHDRLEPPTPLAKLILGEMGGPAGVIDFAQNARPAQFAALAPRILRSEDPAAMTLMRRGCSWLTTGLNALGWRPGEPICLVGGIAPSYASWLPRDMADALMNPAGSALDGALTLARRTGETRPPQSESICGG